MSTFLPLVEMKPLWVLQLSLSQQVRRVDLGMWSIFITCVMQISLKRSLMP